MKRSKLSIGLVTSFIAAMGLTACGSTVTSNDNNVVSFKDYDGNEVGIITNSIYEEYKNSSAGISKFYDAIMEVLIRYEFETADTTKFAKTYEQIKLEAERRVEDKKTEASSNADNNGTSYSTEWEAILEGEGVETEDELLEKYIYAGEKEEIEDWYLKENLETLKAEYLGVDGSGAKVTSKVSARLPYHIRHILVKVSSGATNFYNGTVSADEAKNLAAVAKALVDGKDTFGQIAYYYSEDTGSAALYGDLGIMDTSTSFVNEFKLGIYAYDAILSGRTENTTIEAGLGITSDVKAKLAGGLSYVPYEAIKELGNVKDVTDDDGIRVNGGNENYYPRNILWNKYLNHHNPFVITNNVRNPNDLNGETTSVDVTITEAAAGKTGFRYVPGVCATTNQKVLTDEAGRVLIGVRSEHGIHLMVMQKSIYDFDATTNGISLNDYYTTYTPADAQYPNVSVPTYVTYLSNASQSVLNERATKVKDTIKSFDSTYGYRLYNYFLDQYKLTFNGDLGEEISNYIAAQQEYNIWTNEKDMAKAWRTYLELLEVQEANRTKERLIPEVCAIKFRDAYNSKGELYDADFKEGGQCYYAN